MSRIIGHFNRVTGHLLLIGMILYIFTSPPTKIVAAILILGVLYVLTSKIIKSAYTIFCFLIPLALGILFPLKQLNAYPSVAVFCISFIWTTLFFILLLFFDYKKIQKDCRPDKHEKKQ